MASGFIFLSWTQQTQDIMMIKTANIFQVLHVEAKPSEVFEMLSVAEKHAAFTQKSASIDLVEGGEFAFCNNNHTGYFMRIIKNRRLVLAWTHRKFPRHHFSIVDLQFEKDENGGTRISLNHIGVPESCDGWLTEAWKKTYWEPLTEYISEALELSEN